jgi:hypothetical protein
MSGQIHSPAVSHRGKSPDTHWIRGYVDLDAVAERKIPNLYRESNPDHQVLSLVTVMIELSLLLTSE